MNNVPPIHYVGMAGFLALCAACASVPVPNEQLAVSRSAISDALTAGAADLAPQELQSARDKLAQANSAVAAGNNREARRLAEEAEVDARLAGARANTQRSRMAVVEIQRSLRALKEQLNSAPQAIPAPSAPQPGGAR